MVTVRICELRVGDVFEMYGIRWRVSAREGGRVFFGQLRHNGGWWLRSGKDGDRGWTSQQFVYLITKAAYEQTTGMVGQDPETGNGGD